MSVQPHSNPHDFLPAYIRARKRWGTLYNRSLEPILLGSNPALPPFSLNAPLGSDFQNYYPALYNGEKSAIATVLGSLNPTATTATPTTAFREYQDGNTIFLTQNVATLNPSTWAITKDDTTLPSYGLIMYPGTAGYIYTSAPVGQSTLMTIASLDVNGNWLANNYPPPTTPLPAVGGWTTNGTYAFNFESWAQWAKITVTGAGGGGGTGYRNGSGGGGAGAGGTVIIYMRINPQTMNPCNIVVGAGGATNSQEGGGGGIGGDSSFSTADSSIYVIGKGGTNGFGGGSSLGNGGAGGGGIVSAGSNYEIFTGNAGVGGTWVIYLSPPNAGLGGGGNGGGSYWGGGGSGAFTQNGSVPVAGGNGFNGGGAGGGAAQYAAGPTGATYSQGGYGGDGVVMVERYA